MEPLEAMLTVMSGTSKKPFNVQEAMKRLQMDPQKALSELKRMGGTLIKNPAVQKAGAIIKRAGLPPPAPVTNFLNSKL